jgi:hypothetical protein
MINTYENRKKFASRFYCQHPDGPYTVDETTANIVLDFLDNNPEELTSPNKLWSFIMQNRKTFMLGQIHVIEMSKTKNVTPKRYSKIGDKVVSIIIKFVMEELKP